jgi:putative membrane protein
MQPKEPEVAVREDKLATEFLANERTFLAWIRTSISVITLGFLIAKFGVWLRELSTHLAPQTRAPHSGSSLYVGIVMMVFGGLVAILAARRYHVVNLAIEHGKVSADRGLVFLVTAIVAVLSVAMIVYLVISAT